MVSFPIAAPVMISFPEPLARIGFALPLGTKVMTNSGSFENLQHFTSENQILPIHAEFVLEDIIFGFFSLLAPRWIGCKILLETYWT